MPFINVGPQGGWSLGAIIAIVILILAIVFMVIGHISPFAILAMIAGLALARLT